MMTSRIIGTGSFVPTKTVSNFDLSELVDTNNDWIVERTGIVNRRIAQTDSTVSLAVKAALAAIENASIKPDEIDLIIVATFTPDNAMPNTACEVQKAIGAYHAFCFDLNAACSGFIYALQTAHVYLKSGMSQTALVIGAETISRIIDWKDRSTCILFGDGAGAVIVKQASHGIIDILSGSDGSKGEFLTQPYAHLTTPFSNSDSSSILPYLKMDGQEIFKFAVRKVPETILTLTTRANITPTQIQHYLLHQANKRIIHAVAKRLQVKEECFSMNLEKYGNTSAASIPILLDELNRMGKLKEKEYLIFSGFGGGLTWGTILLQW